jgi:hypothetical protein
MANNDEVPNYGAFGGQIPSRFTTILNGASLSDLADFGSLRPVAIIMPAAWTAASITLQVGSDGQNVADMYDSTGAEYTLTVTASRFILLKPLDFIAVRGAKLRSGTGGVPVNQGADRIIKWVLVP